MAMQMEVMWSQQIKFPLSKAVCLVSYIAIVRLMIQQGHKYQAFSRISYERRNNQSPLHHVCFWMAATLDSIRFHDPRKRILFMCACLCVLSASPHNMFAEHYFCQHNTSNSTAFNWAITFTNHPVDNMRFTDYICAPLPTSHYLSTLVE